MLDNLIFLAGWVGGSSQDILTISTFLLEHSFMLKSYRVGGWWVAYKILLSAQSPGFGTWDLGIGDRAWQFESEANSVHVQSDN